MTRECDRIQENASKYIVKNCPSILPMTKLCDSESTFNCGTFCKDCTDCLIKRVYETCKNQKEFSCIFAVAILADRILPLFDIEEVK